MAKNEYWTIKDENGWLWEYPMRSTRRAAIEAYLKPYNNGIHADKHWAWHKRNRGVSVVKVRIVEVEK